jgi:DNA-directed RNA polymerase specialized sigma subunit
MKRPHAEEVSLETNSVDRIVDPSPDALDQATERSMIRLIRESLKVLTRRQLEVIILRYRHEETFESIAQILDISKASAFHLHERAIRALQREFYMRSLFFVRDVM